jgi:UDPglucose 6-dehydrogenase
MSKQDDLRIAVLGLGHVGLPTALGLAELGWQVVGADADLEKANVIAAGTAPFYEPGVKELLRQHLDSGTFVVETDVTSAMRGATVIFVCVGTPQGEDGAPDLSQVEAVSRALASNMNGYKLIVEKSTTPVRTSRHVKASILRHAQSDLSDAGNGEATLDFDVAVNPEFLREGTAIHDFFNPDRIVLGVESERAADILLQVYQPLLDRMGTTAESTLIFTDCNTAEIIKHASNAFLATKISFVNMLADLCEATGANVDDVAHGLGMDPRIGPQFLKAGIGYGGYCLPKDIRAFIGIAASHRVDFSLLGEVERINRSRVARLLSRVRESLWVVKGKRLAVWGLAFKPGTDDVREAPSLAVVRGLLEEGAQLRLYDPQAMSEFRRHFAEEPPVLTYCATAEDASSGADALLVLTDWREFLDVDLAQVRDRMAVPLIVDARNLLDPAAVRALRFEYHSIGRL